MGTQKKSPFAVFSILFVGVMLSVTIYLVNQPQDLRQRAETKPSPTVLPSTPSTTVGTLKVVTSPNIGNIKVISSGGKLSSQSVNGSINVNLEEGTYYVAFSNTNKGSGAYKTPLTRTINITQGITTEVIADYTTGNTSIRNY